MRIFKYILISIIALFLLLISAGVVISTYYGDDVKRLFLSELKLFITAEYEINEDFDFSIIDHFPEATLTFNSVKLKGSIPNDTTTFANIGHLSFQFNIWDLYHKKYDITKISLDNGTLYIRIDDSGLRNFDILKKPEKPQKDISLHLKRVICNNLNVLYLNKPNHQQYDFKIEKGKFTGNFAATTILLNIDSDIEIKQLLIKNREYLNGLPAHIKMNLTIDPNGKSYKVDNGIISIADNMMNMKGVFQIQAKSTNIELEINGKEARIQKIIDLLPQEYYTKWAGLSNEGNLVYTVNLSGKINKPEIKIDFSLREGTISYKDIDEPVSDVNFDAKFLINEKTGKDPSMLEVSTFSGIIKGEPIRFSMSIKDFTRPFIKVKLDATVRLEHIDNYLQKAGLSKWKGKVALTNINLHTRMDTHFSTIENTDISGNLGLEELSGKWQNHSFSGISGNVIIDKNGMSTKDLKVSINNNELALSARFSNLTSAILDQITDSASQMPTLTFIARIVSEKIILEELLQLKKGNPKNGGRYNFAAPFTLLKGNLSLNVDQYFHNSFYAEDIKGNVQFNQTDIYIDQLSFNVMDGKVESKGKVVFNDNARIEISSEAELHQINIKKLFSNCANFGQHTITDKHLDGTMDAELNLLLPYAKDLSLLYNEIEARIEIVINDGELINYRPLYDLSRFVKLEELKHIKFSKLQNSLVIKDEKVYIPKMEIESSAMNLTISGIHRFNNEIDYNLRINLSNLLSKKARKQQSEFEEEPGGAINLFLTMRGTTDDPIIKYDAKSVKKKIKESLAKEKKELIEVIKREFTHEVEEGEIKDWEPDESEEYIEWEEEDEDSLNYRD